jgi:hypothetical protein
VACDPATRGHHRREIEDKTEQCEGDAKLLAAARAQTAEPLQPDRDRWTDIRHGEGPTPGPGAGNRVGVDRPRRVDDWLSELPAAMASALPALREQFLLLVGQHLGHALADLVTRHRTVFTSLRHDLKNGGLLVFREIQTLCHAFAAAIHTLDHALVSLGALCVRQHRVDLFANLLPIGVSRLTLFIADRAYLLLLRLGQVQLIGHALDFRVGLVTAHSWSTPRSGSRGGRQQNDRTGDH